jgi:FMN phosphatase YigB (HAD superfamily)
MSNSTLVKGSLTEVAKKNNRSIAVGFMNVKAFVMVDVSASMRDRDAGGDKSRYDATCEQLERLQDQNPGEIAVACFSERAEFCPGGVPVMRGQSTDMVAALRMLKMADATDIRLVIISDGEPNDQAAALSEAAKFASKIDTIYIGPETGSGREFLRELSSRTGGVSITNETEQLGKLSENITRLIAA